MNQKGEKMECSNCRAKVSEKSNFCKKCGTKLHEKCNCWVKKQDNYYCGESSCPGFGLFRIEKLKVQ